MTKTKQYFKNRLIIHLIVFVLITLTIMILVKLSNNKKNNLLIFSYLFNGYVWLLLFIREVKKRAYLLVMIQWLFCIFFFELAPLI